MKKYLVKGTYSYKVQKIIMADSEEDAIRTAGDVEPLCEWDSQEQNTYREIINSIEEQRGVSNE